MSVGEAEVAEAEVDEVDRFELDASELDEADLGQTLISSRSPERVKPVPSVCQPRPGNI